MRSLVIGTFGACLIIIGVALLAHPIESAACVFIGAIGVTYFLAHL